MIDITEAVGRLPDADQPIDYFNVQSYSGNRGANYYVDVVFTRGQRTFHKLLQDSLTHPQAQDLVHELRKYVAATRKLTS